MESVLKVLKSAGGTAVAWFSPLIEPISNFLKWAWSKGYILAIAYMAKRQGKKEARQESVEEVLKHVDETKKARNSEELRKIVGDMYNR